MGEAPSRAAERGDTADHPMSPRPGPRPRWLGHRGFHLFALSGLALAQPLLDVLGRHPEDLVGLGIGGKGVGWLAALVVLAVPAILAALTELGRKVHLPFAAPETTLGDALHLVFIALLGSLLSSLWLARLLPLPAIAHLALSALLGTALATLYRRRQTVRQLLSWLAPLVLVIPVRFLLFTPVRDLILPASTATPAGGNVGAPDAAPTTPVVAVVFDELPVISLMNRQREIDPVLYPRFAELGRSATWFRNATTPATLTWRSVPALLTGRYPRDRQHSTLEHHPRNLFTWLLEQGYELTVTEPYTQLCPPDHLVRPDDSRSQTLHAASAVGVLVLHLSLPPSFDPWLPDLTTAWVRELGSPVESFRAFVDGVRATGGPQLVFLHTLLPHHPWRYLPSGKAYHVANDEIGVEGLEPAMNVATARWSDDGWAVTQAYQRHLLQLQLTDRLLGEFLDRLRRLDLFDRALIVVAADHGVSFRRGGLVRQPDAENYEDLVAVPLLIKFPFQEEGKIDDRDVELIDVLLTIAEVLGIEPDWSVEGRSILAPAVERERKLVYHTPDDVFWIGDPTVAEKYISLARKLLLFPADSDPLAAFRMGPFHRELLGRSLDALDVRDGGGLAGVIDFRDRYDHLDPTAAVIPSRVTGHLETADLPGPRPLALAVDGVIRAVTLTRHGDGNRYFSFMVPETAWHAGPNDLTLLAVSQPEGSLVLEELELPAPVGYSLVLDDRGSPNAVRSSRGRSYRVDASRFSGQAADIVYQGRTYQVIYLGWAMNGSTGQRAERIVLFDDERFLYAGGLNFDREASRARYKMGGREDFAFHYVVSRQDIRGTVRIFGLFPDGTARPLVYTQKLEPQEMPFVRQ